MVTIQKVRDYLMEHPEAAKPCWLSLQAGCFSGQKASKDDIEDIPPTRTHLNLLSHKFIKKALHSMVPELTFPMMAKIAKQNTGELLQLFCFAVSEKPEAGVFTHSGKAFISHYKHIHEVLGNRLRR
eukprot:5222367-Lingulodinium_polyedra.AAC.1